MTTKPLTSRTILEGRDRAPARSFLKGIGYTNEDLSKPIIGIANTPNPIKSVFLEQSFFINFIH